MGLFLLLKIISRKVIQNAFFYLKCFFKITPYHHVDTEKCVNRVHTKLLFLLQKCPI